MKSNEFAIGTSIGVITIHPIKRLDESQCWDDGILAKMQIAFWKSNANRKKKHRCIIHIQENWGDTEIDGSDMNVEMKDEETNHIPTKKIKFPKEIL